MSQLKTATDLGNIIRQRRKSLDWDQARLAHESGVSRQWVVDIEKGKPRAEVHLVLRVLNVLGLTLWAETGDSAQRTGPALASIPDVDDVVTAHQAVGDRHDWAAQMAAPSADKLRVNYDDILRSATTADDYAALAESPAPYLSTLGRKK